MYSSVSHKLHVHSCNALVNQKRATVSQRKLKREEKSSFYIQGRAHYLAAHKFVPTPGKSGCPRLKWQPQRQSNPALSLFMWLRKGDQRKMKQPETEHKTTSSQCLLRWRSFTVKLSQSWDLWPIYHTEDLGRKKRRKLCYVIALVNSYGGLISLHTHGGCTF